MILMVSYQGREADPSCRGEDILEKVGESWQWQETSKGRFYMTGSVVTGSIEQEP
jgi:hypothetical protein